MHSLSGKHDCEVGLALSSVVGNRTMSLRLIDAARSHLRYLQEPLWFGALEDYQKYAAPKLLRFSSQIESEFVFRRKLRYREPEFPPLVIACTLQVAAAIAAYDPGARLVVATDSTPAFTARLYRGAETPRWNSRAKAAINKAIGWRYSGLIKRVSAWLPMSELCKQSLINDYRVSAEVCFVTRSPQLNIANIRQANDTSRGLEILMVANDFILKGGRELVSAVMGLDNVRLTIISNDAKAIAVKYPGKIEVVSGLRNPQDMISYYRSAHLLVHPTRRDCYSHVMCEALAQGCPVAVTEGVPPAEIVNESGAGWIIQRPVNAGAIIELLRHVIASPSEIDRRSVAAIRYAQSHLSMEKFGSTIVDAVTRAVCG